MFRNSNDLNNYAEIPFKNSNNFIVTELGMQLYIQNFFN